MTADPVTVSRELSGLTSSSAVLDAYAESVMNTFGMPKAADTWTCCRV